MATRIYTGIDFINVIRDLVINPGSINIVPAEQNVIGVVISPGDSNFFPDPAFPLSAGSGVTIDFDYTIIANIDWSKLIIIPSNALISRVEVKIDASISASASSAASGPNATTSARGNAAIAVYRNEVELMPDILLADTQTAPGNGSASVSLSAVDHYTATQVYDYSLLPLTKAELEVEFASFLFKVSTDPDDINTQASADLVGGSGNSSAGAGLSLDNVRITITYDAGPVTHTISPAGGLVPPGQIITVTGPGVAEEDFFFETDDGIITVEPQIISEDEVRIEIPYPASDPCFDCFPSCPECDAAFAPCDADFSSEACQAAIQNCLDCLSECLEDLERAEECQESTHNHPTTPPPVILIVGTQFSGNVSLGNFTILNADGSGLYRFEMGKTHDTLYAPDRDGTTYDVKIPNPGGKTGFFRS